MDPVYTDEKLGVFLKNVVQNRIFSIFLNFPKYCFFFGFWKLIFNILEILKKMLLFGGKKYIFFSKISKILKIKPSRFKWIFENISTCQGRQGAHWAHVPPRALY